MLRGIIRIAAAALALLAACLTAMIVVAAGLSLVLGLSGAAASPADVFGNLVVVTIVGAAYLPALVLAPAFVAVAAGEIFSWRACPYYAGAGVLTTLAALAAINLEGDRASEAGHPLIEVPLFLVAGAAGGLAYWLLAGRRAGAASKRTGAQ
jgi:hypothetical protein